MTDLTPTPDLTLPRINAPGEFENFSNSAHSRIDALFRINAQGFKTKF